MNLFDRLSWLALIVGGLMLLNGGNLPSLPTVSPEKATAATYVYEKDVTAVPVPVLVAINRLNREKKVVASHFEEDTTDGDEQVPDQYRVPLKAAQDAGLPSLVVTAGEKVLKVVKDPKTEQQVMEAVQ
jgi:hypothetical protein